MKLFDGWMRVLLGLAVVIAVIGVWGCENGDDDDESLSVSPTSITVPLGVVTNIEINASGGAGGYAWDVDNGSLGSIVGAGGTAIYTSTDVAGLNFIILTDSISNAVSVAVTHL